MIYDTLDESFCDPFYSKYGFGFCAEISYPFGQIICERNAEIRSEKTILQGIEAVL